MSKTSGIKASGECWEIRKPRALSTGGHVTDIYIYGDIGESWDEESTSAASFVRALADLEATAELSVGINSYGGAVADGLAIFNTLRSHEGQVTTRNDGVAMSSASLILMAGDEVQAAENSLTMIHAPWSMTAGNAAELRKTADDLDVYAKAMASAYTRGGITPETALALLQDGEDHIYTAVEAKDMGLVDIVSPAFEAAAKYRDNRFTNPSQPAGANPQTAKGVDMPKKIEAAPDVSEPEAKTIEPEVTPVAATAEPVNVVAIEQAAESRFRSELAARNAQLQTIRAVATDKQVIALVNEALADVTMTMAQFYDKVNDLTGKDTVPLNAQRPEHVEPGADSRDKFIQGAAKAVAARMNVGEVDRGNEFRGLALHELAAQALNRAGISSRGMTKREIASKVLAAHTTSDFPLILEDAANKRLQAAYGAFDSTWDKWCDIGESPDFKANNRYRLGSFSTLDTKAEGAAYTEGTVNEEKESLTVATKGKYIQMTREMLVNDDLNGFSRMTGAMGSAAGRTVEKDVYTLLIANPAMSDTFTLFDELNHGNTVAAGGAMSVATIGAGRTAMRKQQDPTLEDYLDIRPSYLLVPVELEDTANVIMASETDPGFTNSKKPNAVRNVAEVIASPWLTNATAWYLIANAMDAPLMEVAFLDGQRTPYLDSEEQFLNDTVQWKVRLDYGVAPIDWRGGYRNPGA